MPSVIPTAVWGRVRVPSGPQESPEQSGLFAFMAYYVYIIQSLQDNTYYKGFSEQPQLRLVQHNNGECDLLPAKDPGDLFMWSKCLQKRCFDQGKKFKESRNATDQCTDPSYKKYRQRFSVAGLECRPVIATACRKIRYHNQQISRVAFQSYDDNHWFSFH